MPEEKKTKYDLLQEQVDSLKKTVDSMAANAKQIEECLTLFDHFKEVIKNTPIADITTRIDSLERNINERAVETSIFERLAKVEKRLLEFKGVDNGISPAEYFAGGEKDAHFHTGNKHLDNSGKVVHTVKREDEKEPVHDLPEYSYK